ncbi:hypothetical protein MANY_00140 [Mycolicibacterium anyangense]|uniref:Carrier domain-containing protein n=1 Tax=Mycolicibacterium anyangense TaxID=1431246 RepID=A0A6N4W3L5_9MYCO|nr:hypothetical protein MANY_00140 [Mycolicibacterium anyangense]
MVNRLAERDRRRQLDLAQPPLTRYTLVRRGADRYTMIQTVHHIVADGWSVPLVLRDLLTAYDGVDFGGPAPQFSAFTGWLSDRDDAADRSAWQSVLAGIEEPTTIAAADGTDVRGDGFGTRQLELGPRTELSAAAARASVTVGTLLHSAWGIVLGRLTARPDVVFGTVVSGRHGDLPGIEEMVGLLVNTVPVRVRWSPSDTAAQVAGRLAERESTVLDHHHLPLTEAHQISGLPALFDTLVVIENLGSAALSGAELSFGAVTVVEAPHYPLTLMIAVHDTVTLTVTNDRAHVSDAFADSVAAAVRDLLATVVADPGVPCGAVPLGSPLSRPATAPAGTVTALLADAISRNPDRTALVCGDRRVSYTEIDHRAAAFAHRLTEAGVGRGDVVALSMVRDADLVAALWAVIGLGAAYLPVDPTYPQARVSFMLGHARPRAVLVDQIGAAAVAGAIPEGCTVIGSDTVDGGGPWRPVPVGPLDAVSVLYTSGSTGEPKAVVGSHGALAHRVRWALADWPAQVRLAKSSLSFIDGTTELLAGLAAGTCTILADDTAARDGRLMAELIAAHDVAQLVAVPSLAHALAGEHRGELASVRRWILSGEPLESGHIAALRAACPAAAIVNSYGSSEVTGDVLAGEQHGEAVTLGHVVPGTTVRILDHTLSDVPAGAIGEIYVSGEQLARGYLHRPAQTATRFVATPGGGRMYRTGDLGALRPDGTVMFAGRVDEQIKVNGYRVEPGEIESVLLSHNDVVGAAVIATGSALAAFAVGDAVDTAELRAWLDSRLPRHLAPGTITRIDRIPLLPNGKRDAAALRSLAHGQLPESVGTVGPADPVQHAIVEVMADVLGRAAVSADADFFALGGDSIGAIRLTSRLARRGYLLTTEDVFRHRSAMHLASAATPTADPAPAPVERFVTVALSADAIERLGPDVEDVWAMSPLQQGLYYQSTLDGAGSTYIVQNTFDFDRHLDANRCRHALHALLARHPQLRVGFGTIEDGERTTAVQVVAAGLHPDIAVVDLSTSVDPAGESGSIADSDRTTAFDVAVPPLLRITLMRLPDGRDRMLFTYHFLLFDGWSRELVLREFFALYASDGQRGMIEPHGDVVVRFLQWRAALGDTDATQAWRELLAGVEEPTLATGAAPEHPTPVPVPNPAGS